MLQITNGYTGLSPSGPSEHLLWLHTSLCCCPCEGNCWAKARTCLLSAAVSLLGALSLVSPQSTRVLWEKDQNRHKQVSYTEQMNGAEPIEVLWERASSGAPMSSFLERNIGWNYVIYPAAGNGFLEACTSIFNYCAQNLLKPIHGMLSMVRTVYYSTAVITAWDVWWQREETRVPCCHPSCSHIPVNPGKNKYWSVVGSRATASCWMCSSPGAMRKQNWQFKMTSKWQTMKPGSYHP